MTHADKTTSTIFQALARGFQKLADDMRFSTMSRYPWTMISAGESAPMLKGSIYVPDHAAFETVKARLVDTLGSVHIGIDNGRVDFTSFHVDAGQERAMVMALVDAGFYAGNIVHGCLGPVAGDGHYCITTPGVNPGSDAHYMPHDSGLPHTRRGDWQPA